MPSEIEQLASKRIFEDEIREGRGLACFKLLVDRDDRISLVVDLARS